MFRTVALCIFLLALPACGPANEAKTDSKSIAVEKPDAPNELKAVAGEAKITLTWQASARALSYKVLRGDITGGPYSELTTVPVTTATDKKLKAGKTYFYVVHGVNEAGVSAISGETSATAQGPLGTGLMASIPAGCFSMGDAWGDGNSGELPVHNVCLSAFEMDVKEVSNAQYKACWLSGGCALPGLSSVSRTGYFVDATYADFPVIRMGWADANDYCTWALKRLPTEAEWEYAARGGLAGKRFPWGDSIECTQANYSTGDGEAYDVDSFVGEKICVGDTTSAGSYSANAYGLYDMTGNVWEWVNDWYGSSYYAGRPNPDNDPTGPATGAYRLVRGGGLSSSAYAARVSYRYSSPPVVLNTSIGFRCAR